MARLALAALGLVSVVTALAIGSGSTYRSTRFSYPVTVQLPPEVVAVEVSYLCFFDREIAEFTLGEALLQQPFAGVDGVQFNADVRGHHDTSWFGLFENVGRESFILVRVEAASGDIYAGLAELPPSTGSVTVAVERAA